AALFVALVREHELDVAHRSGVAAERDVAQRAELPVDTQALVEWRLGRGALIGARRVELSVAVGGGDEPERAPQSMLEPRVVGRFAKARAELSAPLRRIVRVPRLFDEAGDP